MLVTSIFSFSHNVFNPIRDKNHHSSCIILLSANAFNFDQSKILSLGKELIQQQKKLAYENIVAKILREMLVASILTISNNVIPSLQSHTPTFEPHFKLIGGSNTVVSAYTLYRHLQHKAILWTTFDKWEQYCCKCL